MVRKRLSAEIADTVLIACRRRCCICYGLHRDASEKRGQIAHLDQDSSNSALENLAFLCLDHHDAYDGRTSQSKGFTIGEVKQFRAELRNVVQRVMEQDTSFGTVRIADRDPFAGHYVRIGSDISCSAELDVTPIPDSPTGEIRYVVSGFAVFGGHKSMGPNTGTLEFLAELRAGRIEHRRRSGDDGEAHIITIQFREGGLSLAEVNWLGQYGMNVTFGGDYAREAPIDYSEWAWSNPEARQVFGSDRRGN